MRSNLNLFRLEIYVCLNIKFCQISCLHIFSSISIIVLCILYIKIVTYSLYRITYYAYTIYLVIKALGVK